MFKYISKKINDKYIVWFEQSNRWVQFQEPAWYVTKLSQKGIDKNSIYIKCSKKYSLPLNESKQFVNEICERITELSSQVIKPDGEIAHPSLPDNFLITPYATRYYLINKKHFTLVYDSRLSEYYIHPPLAHLETKHSKLNSIQFEILNYENIPFLRVKGNSEITTAFDDYNRLKHQLFIEISNIIYNKTSNDWISFVHASALSNKRKTILLSCTSGSGKSSMAALLQAKGLQFVSDDFVPLDAKTKRAFPFPAAISVKEGSFSLLSPYYGDLHDNNYNKYEYSSNSIRYLQPEQSNIFYYKALPVKNIIFIRYNAQVSCIFKSVTNNEALKLFHDEAWVSPDPEHAKSFINWFVKLHCFSLEYGNTEQAIDKILEVFNT
jgi:hypothetical protein